MKRIPLTLAVALVISGAQELKASNTFDVVSTNEPRQILIEAVLLEVPAMHAKELYLGFSGTRPMGPSGSKIGLSNSTNAFGSVTKLNDSLESVTTTLARDKRVRILQRPRIQTSHDVPATLFVGETLPAAKRSQADAPGAETAAQGVPVGLTFEVSPMIGPEGSITMDLHFRIDRVVRHMRVAGAGEVPVINTSEVRTKVHLRDREANLLDGLRISGSRERKPDLRSPKDQLPSDAFARDATLPNEVLIVLRPTLVVL